MRISLQWFIESYVEWSKISTMPLKCVVHRITKTGVRKRNTFGLSPKKHKDEKLIKLNNERWNNIKICAETRKSMTNYHSSPYIIELLPENLPDDGAYHSSCYSNFTSV